MKKNYNNHPLYTDPSFLDWDYAGERTFVLHAGLALPDWWMEKIGNIDPTEEISMYYAFYLQGEKTNIVMLSSQKFNDDVVKYYLDNVAAATGLDTAELKKRIAFVTLDDDRPYSCIRKLDDHPDKLKQLKELVTRLETSVFVSFMPDERLDKLASELGLPYYANPPATRVYDQKSGTRKLCKEVGVPVPDGREDLHSIEDVFNAWQAMGSKEGKFVLKLNNADSGSGMFMINVDSSINSANNFIEKLKLPDDENIDDVLKRLELVGGAFEEFVLAKEMRSPSVQFEIFPSGAVVEVSTHEQYITGVHFAGCDFPADPDYRKEIVDLVKPAMKKMAVDGVRGKIGVDLISFRNDPSDAWQHLVVEFNIRLTTTGFAFQWVQNLTNSEYREDGLLYTASGKPVYYFQTSGWGVELDERVKKYTVKQFLKEVEENDLLFAQEKGEGVFFQLLDNVPIARATYVVIGNSPARVQDLKLIFEKEFFPQEKA